MKVLVTGGGGQLASELLATQPDAIEVIVASRETLDITNAEHIDTFFTRHQPDVVINAAAYTAVDKAEDDREKAYSVNRDGPALLADACIGRSFFLHISTDFIFDGQNNRPYSVDAEPKPLSVYGDSKLAGEQRIQASALDDWAIIRTSWVYSIHGANFVKSMLNLMGRLEKLNIVYDQIGTPTWARGLAEVCWEVASQRAQGIFHWSDAGVSSWYDFAIAIQKLGLENGLLDVKIPIAPIPTEAYPLPATRPSYSVLDKRHTLESMTGLEHKHWMLQLESMIKALKET